MTEPAQATIRVVVASDFFLTREGLACLLARVPGIDVVGRVDSHAATIEAASRDEPDVIVVGMPWSAGGAVRDSTSSPSGNSTCWPRWPRATAPSAAERIVAVSIELVSGRRILPEVS